MKLVGIVCEYNPLHTGHARQLHTVRQTVGRDCGIVCLMSGNFVQRGAPAIVDKMLRAEAALQCGADLVLELPVTAALSSAEGFAAQGVRFLQFCDKLCFGVESSRPEGLLDLARALLREDYPPVLRKHLALGLSFPAARQAALAEMGLDAAPLSLPNNILAVEYCKAILSLENAPEPMPILRGGDYRSTVPDVQNPSATALRRLMEAGKDWKPYLPPSAAAIFENAPLHTLAAGERSILGKLRSMEDKEFEELPYGSEGLWRRLMHAARQEADLEAVAAAVKSKRYTRSRIDRMILCAFLGITQAQLAQPAPYARVLGFTDRGRQILNIARETLWLPNVGQDTGHPYQALEYRAGNLYGLFCQGAPEPPGQEPRRRVVSLPDPIQ